MPVQGGPKSASNCLARSTFSLSCKPMPTNSSDCSFAGLCSGRGSGPCLPKAPVGNGSCEGGCSAAAFRVSRPMSPSTTSSTTPAVMPWWMERGTSMIVTKEGMAMRMLFQAMLLLGSIMKAPVMTSGAAAARSGMAVRRGVRKAESANSTAMVTAERPVLAPSRMPALLSFAMTSGLVPSRPATMVPSAEPTMMKRLRGTAPCRRRPAML
mmetsp:Transcript_122516/g.357753  ORF Transcript_122516/g.357753 Transcript_122516/m.357753 type:complete len:211 (-) Transcript_122516:1101-1733(-)